MSRKNKPSFSCVDGKFKRLWLLEEGDEKNGYEKNKNGPVLMGLILVLPQRTELFLKFCLKLSSTVLVHSTILFS